MSQSTAVSPEGKQERNKESLQSSSHQTVTPHGEPSGNSRWENARYWPQIAERKKESKVARWCPTLCNPMDCSLPGFSIQGIFQARVLEWVAISFSRGSSLPGIKPGSPTLQADSLQLSHLESPHMNMWFFSIFFNLAQDHLFNE